MSAVQPMPLEEFSVAMRERIEHLAAQPKPPPRWLDFGYAQITSRAWWEWHRRRGRDPHKRRENIPPHIRARVLARDGLICQLCNGPVERDDVHLDHRHPVSLGGRNGVDNLQVTHSRCNLRKGNRVDLSADA